MNFIGRKKELESLKSLKAKKTASFVVVKGRRRIGKSRLIKEFAKDYTSYSFTGFPPDSETTAVFERKTFAIQLEKFFGVPVRYDNWYELFVFLSERTKDRNTVILFDEISWMGSRDTHFLGALKTAWDEHFKQNTRLVLIVCGSVSSWIENNILSSTGFVGRISLTLTVKELSLKESCMFWDKYQTSVSGYEKLKLLAVTGGVPRYLEEIDPKLSAEDNIKKLCFIDSGILYQDFDQIFNDLFSSKLGKYKEIVSALVSGARSREELIADLGKERSGRFSIELDELVKAGFLQRDFVWSLKNGYQSKLSKYRLADNYLRFYLKYIDPNKHKISKGFFQDMHLSSFQGWSGVMGLQIENLVLNNRLLILEKLGIPPSIVVNDGPYFQHKTKRIAGCQIDYLIQTKLSELYIVEIKFHKKKLGKDIITEMQERIKRLSRPKNFSLRPVLIHAGELDTDVEEADYFVKIIDLTQEL